MSSKTDLLSENNYSNNYKDVNRQINLCKSMSEKFWNCIEKNLNSYMCINEFYNLDKCVNLIRSPK